MAALVGALGLFALPALPSDAQAGSQIYTYIDGAGVVHYSNLRNAPHRDPRYKRMRTRPVVARRAGRDAPRHYGYDGLIDQTARAHRVPAALVKAVIAAESLFDPSAVSHKGAQGLMQLMPATASELGVADPLEPTQNVQGGVSYLRAMIDRYGDLTRAVAAYNAGPTAVDRYGGVPPYRETRDYVARVLTYYRQYHGDFR